MAKLKTELYNIFINLTPGNFKSKDEYKREDLDEIYRHHMKVDRLVEFLDKFTNSDKPKQIEFLTKLEKTPKAMIYFFMVYVDGLPDEVVKSAKDIMSNRTYLEYKSFLQIFSSLPV